MWFKASWSKCFNQLWIKSELKELIAENMPYPTKAGEDCGIRERGKISAAPVSLKWVNTKEMSFNIFRSCGLQPSKRCLSLWKTWFSERHWLYVELLFSHPANLLEKPALGSLSTALCPLWTSLFSCECFSHLLHHLLWRTPHCHLLSGTFSSQQSDFGALFSWGMGRRRTGGCYVLGLVVCWKK